MVVNSFLVCKSYDEILSEQNKTQEKYNYLLYDSLLDKKEIKKFFKIYIYKYLVLKITRST